MKPSDIATKSIPTLDAINLEIFYRRHEVQTITDAIAEKYMYGDMRISVAPKLRPIFDHNKDQWTDVKYFLLWGGRGGAKSESVGELLVLIARSETTRILCTREIQNAIADSVKQVIEDWIDTLGLRHEFSITDKRIMHKKTKTDFIFMGLKTGTDTASVKGLKGVKYIWVEEAQTLTEPSFRMLKDTIRIDGAQFFITYNPRTKFDVVEEIKKRRKAHSIHINYMDNPFLPQTQLDEALEDKELDYKLYLHNWEGQPRVEDASSIVLPYEQLSQCMDLHLTHGFSEGSMFSGFDIADGQLEHHDRNSFAARAGATIHRVEEWQIPEVYQSVRKVHGFYGELGYEDVNYDVAGLGVAAKSEYARLIDEESKKTDGFQIPYNVVPINGAGSPLGGDIAFVQHGANVIRNKDYFRNIKTQLWWNVRLRLLNSMKLIAGHPLDREGYYLSFSSQIANLDALWNEMSQATFKLDSGGRRIIDKEPGVREIKVEGKTKKIKSPNKADSVNLSFAKDLQFGLRAHGDEEVEEVHVPEPIAESGEL